MELLICDFCSSPHVHWVYPADTFDLRLGGNNMARSLEEWVACEDCSHLIETEQWDKLSKKSVQMLVDAAGLPADHFKNSLKFMKILHREFRIHRKGPRQILLLGRFENAAKR